jgi:hypothetical protein
MGPDVNTATHEMLLLISEAAELGMPPDDLVDFLHANRVGTPIERVMRIRALAELAAHTDVTTLMALAAAASAPSAAISDLLSTLASKGR